MYHVEIDVVNLSSMPRWTRSRKGNKAVRLGSRASKPHKRGRLLVSVDIPITITIRLDLHENWYCSVLYVAGPVGS